MIRTRFAPSPTGYLHIGGVRTALFCWLFARKHGGQFILRIDDTDQQRNVEEALQPILEGLHWLGIDWDEGPGVGGLHAPYYQSQRSEKYQAAVDELIRSGFAYRDFAKPEEIQAERDAAIAEKKTFTYSRRWMAETETIARRFESEGRQGVVRLKMPREGQLVINDLIRGRVVFDWATEQDHVIQRADGSFIYHLANVVDDQDFEISHVIRAEEHLSNTPRQIFMIQSLGYRLPEYAHLPFVAEPGSKTKLSKRKLDKYLKNKDFAKLVQHGKLIADRIGLETTTDGFNPVIVDFYQKVGYLPEAIVNYIALVGWALDDKAEFFRKQDLIDHFSLEGVTKGAASFDPQKLFAFQEKHMLTKSVDEKKVLCTPFLEQAGLLTPHSPFPAFYSLLIQYAGDRIKVGGDILDFSDFFLPDDEFPYDEAAFAKRISEPPEAKTLLQEFRDELAAQPLFDCVSLEQLMQQFLDKKQIKVGQLIHALRIAVTGKSIGFGMFETLEILGKERVLKRLDRTLRK
ncbi:MAG: glutamate--tRNA ligase [Planctomycetaceae bacterium]|jgi:glutamyl-tRNA synthetase|nr:glutamate--tRNA ligase [Planctomycetaceae bacterium]